MDNVGPIRQEGSEARGDPGHQALGKETARRIDKDGLEGDVCGAAQRLRRPGEGEEKPRNNGSAECSVDPVERKPPNQSAGLGLDSNGKKSNKKPSKASWFKYVTCSIRPPRAISRKP